MKKKNGIIVLIIVLSVAVIAGAGYKIADKFYAPLVQPLNHNATISNCTLTPILYGGTLELVCNKDCLFFYITKAELQLQLMIPI